MKFQLFVATCLLLATLSEAFVIHSVAHQDEPINTWKKFKVVPFNCHFCSILKQLSFINFPEHLQQDVPLCRGGGNSKGQL